MRNPPRTVEEAFKLANDMETQLQVADSFKLELSNNFSPVKVNEMSAGETSGEEFEVSELSRGKKWATTTITKDIIQIIIAIAGPNITELRTTKQVRHGTKGKGLQDHFDTGVCPFRS